MLLGFLAQETTGLTVQPYWVLVAIVQFLVIFFLLQRFLWGPIQKTLQARADRIREGLENAEAAKRERAQMQVEVERLHGEARHGAAASADRTTKAAAAAAVQIRAQARAAGDRLRERARADAEQLHQQALSQLRGEVASMAVLAASRILGREVDANAHKALIERSLDEAGKDLGTLN